MTKPDSDINQSVTRTELSRARQRRMKREQPGITGQPAERTNRRRASARGGSSAREQLVAARVKLGGPAAMSIQEKLGEKLGRIAQPPKDDQPKRKQVSASGTTTAKRGGRKKESGWSGTRYASTPQAETQRRNQDEGDYVPRRSRRTYEARSEAVPPVMVRGGMGGMAFGRTATSKLKKNKALRRRYDVPLRVQGAEVRLPSIPFIHLGWRAVSLLMVIMTTASLFLMWKAPVFQVKAMEAEGLKRLTLTDLNAVMRTSGSSVFSLDPLVLKNNLEQAFPEFSSIKVKIGLPASVRVVVTERVPVIAWTQDGSEMWLDSEGVAFPARGTLETELVKVTGYGTLPNIQEAEEESETQTLLAGFPYSTGMTVPKMRLDPDMVAAILALGSRLPADTSVVYDSEHGLGWNDPNGWEVYFGMEDQDMEMKLSVYQALVEQLQNEGIQPELISVEFVHAPYYRMER